jgi:hypothetical protein
MDRYLIKAIQHREAHLAVGPSTLRGQGAAGTVDAAREFLKEIDLRRFSVLYESTFSRRLDDATYQLRRRLPKKAHSFKAARKVMNIFLRNAAYNAHLRVYFGLSGCDE